MKLDTKLARAFGALVPLGTLVLACAVSGCSGGGGEGPQIYGGTLENAAGAPLSGYTVAFDGSSILAAGTDANGQFELTVPPSAVKGNDKLIVTDTSGTIVNAIPASSALEKNDAVFEIAVTPPAPPSTLTPGVRS